MKVLVLLVAVVLLAGCGGGNDEKRSKPSSAELMIDGITGRGAVKAGRRAQDTIERVSAQKQKDLDAVLNANP